MSALEALKLIAPTVHLSAEQGTVSAEQGSVAEAEGSPHGACQLGARCVRVIPPRVEDTGTRAPFAGGRGTYEKVSQ